jgi:hypothetical protein
MDLEIEKDKCNNLETSKLKILRDSISELGLVENIEIFKILQKNNVKYTENNNGIFINMTKLSQKTIDDLEAFLIFIKNNNF